MTTLRLVVPGCAGRMGRTLVRTIHEMDGVEIAGGTERPGHELIGQDVGEIAGIGHIDLPITDDPLPLIAHCHGILDFTVPAAAVETAGLAAQARVVHVIGTTGFTKEDDAKLEAAARHATIIRAGNMSLGVNLLAQLVKKVARTLDEDFDIEIVEMHHRHKVDAPSGTALMLGEAAAEGRSVDLESHADRARDGITGAREKGHIGFAVLRGGSVVGDHTVVFAGEKERIELSHKAEDRSIFARGAVKAAIWGHGKGPGIFSMADVLGFSDA